MQEERPKFNTRCCWLLILLDILMSLLEGRVVTVVNYLVLQRNRTTKIPLLHTLQPCLRLYLQTILIDDLDNKAVNHQPRIHLFDDPFALLADPIGYALGFLPRQSQISKPRTHCHQIKDGIIYFESQRKKQKRERERERERARERERENELDIPLTSVLSFQVHKASVSKWAQ